MLDMARNNASKSTAQQLVEARTGRAVEDQLRELYIDRRFTDQEIGDLLLVSRATIVAWRKQFGIDRAARKASVA